MPNHVIQRVKKQTGEPSPGLCVLLLSGFKIADIAILLDCSPQSVTNIKARANNKLFAENSATTLEKNLMKTIGLPQK